MTTTEAALPRDVEWQRYVVVVLNLNILTDNTSIYVRSKVQRDDRRLEPFIWRRGHLEHLRARARAFAVTPHHRHLNLLGIDACPRRQRLGNQRGDILVVELLHQPGLAPHQMLRMYVISLHYG